MSEDIRKMIDKVKNFNSINEQKLNEISPEKFKSAIDIGRQRELPIRTSNLGRTYFREFIGKEIFGDGYINDIITPTYVHDEGKYVNLQIQYNDRSDYFYDDERFPKREWIRYEVDTDTWINVNWPIERRDARILGRIAEKINPDTKYKETGKHFEIRGWKNY